MVAFFPGGDELSRVFSLFIAYIGLLSQHSGSCDKQQYVVPTE